MHDPRTGPRGTGVALAIGIPIGIIAAKSQTGRGRSIRPHPGRRADDAGLRVPGSLRCASEDRCRSGPDRDGRFRHAPAVRLTMLGIQQVPKDTVEAAHAFGATFLADALQGRASAIAQDDYGRGQPGHHALALDGCYCRTGRGWRARQAGRDGLEPTQRRDQLRRRGRHRGYRHHVRPHHPRYGEAGWGGGPRIFSRRKGSGTGAPEGEA